MLAQIILAMAQTALPIMPPGVAPKPDASYSPKYTEQLNSSGAKMVKAVALVPLAPPVGFTITNLSLTGGRVTLAWQLGQPCYQVQGTTLNGAWSNIGGLTAAHQTQFQEQPQHFFRVSQSNSMPLTLNPTNQPRLTWAKPETDMSDSIANFHVYRTQDQAVSQTEPPGSWTDLGSLPASTTSLTDTTAPDVWYTVRGTTVNGVKIPYQTAELTVAQSGSVAWVKFGHGSQGTIVSGPLAAADALGNVFWAGGFNGTMDFGNGQVSSTPSQTSGYIVKRTAAGAFSWIKTLKAVDKPCSIRGVATDSLNNVVVVGGFQGSMDFGGTTKTSYGVTDAFVAKYDSSGNLVWVKQFGGTYDDLAVGIAIGSSDNITVVGQFQSSNADFGGITLSATGNSQDIFICKLTSAGDTTWAVSYGSANTEIPTGVSLDASGNVFVCGKYIGAADFGGGPVTNAGGFDIFVAKYSGTDGSYMWDKTAGSVNADSNNSVAVNPLTGNVVITGNFIGSMDFGGGSRNSSSGGGVSLYMACYNNSGTYLWDIVTGGDIQGSPDTGFAVKFGPNNKLALAGIFNSWMDFNNDGLNDAPGGGFFIAVFNASGNTKPTFAWAKRNTAASSGGEGTGIAFDASGNMFAAGRFAAQMDLDGNTETAPTASTEPLIAKFKL